MANSGAIRAGGAYVELSVRSAALQRGLRKAQAQVQAFASKAQAAGLAMVAAGTAMATPFALATRKGVEFTDTMAIVGAVTQATGKDFDDLTEKAKNLGATTSFTAQEVAQGMVSLGRAGYDTTQILAAIPDVLNLSRATATELGRAAEIAAAAMRGFGLEASDTGRIADVLTTAANQSAQTLEDLGESMKYVAPQAMEAGATLEDTAAALAVLANNGIKGSMAGTALARAYKNLSATKAQDMLAELNVAAVDSQGNLRNLSDILQELGAATKDMGSAQRLNIFEELFGRGQAAMLKLAGQSDVFLEMAQKMGKAGGEASRLSRAIDDNLGGSFRLLNSAVEGLQLDIFDAIKQDVRSFTESLTAAVGDMAAFVKANNDAILTAAKLTITMIGTGAALTGVGVAAKLAAVGIGILRTSFIALRFTVAITAKAIIATGVAFKALAAGVTVAVNAYKLGIFWITAKTTALGLMSQACFAASAAMSGLSLSIGAVSLALLKFVALPVGVAIAGWHIGKAIADWTGLTEAIEKAYFWLFNIKELSQEDTELEMVKTWKSQLEDGIITLEEYRKRMKALAEVRLDRKNGIDPGDTSANKGHPALGQVDGNNQGIESPEDLEAAAEAEAKEARLKRIREETARLMLKAEYEGIELRRKQIDLAEQQAIAAADGEKDVIAAIQKQYEAKRKILDIETQRTREQEKAQSAEHIAQREKDIKEEIQNLELKLAYDGVKYEKERLKLAEKRALAWAKVKGIDPALIREEFDLREKLLAKQNGENPGIDIASQIASPAEVFGSFSARAVSGRVADQSVRELNKANAALADIRDTNRQLADEGLGLG